MKKSAIIIMDDRSMIASELKSSLPALGCELLAVFTEAEKACHEIESLNPALVLIEVGYENETSLIDAACRIHEVNDVPIVYVAEKLDTALLERTRSTEPYGYLVRPFQEEIVKATLETALYKHSRDVAFRRERDFYLSLLNGKEKSGHIFVKADYKIQRIELEDICYVEALKDYVAIHTVQKTLTSHTSMKEIIKVLPPKDFIQIHRSYIVRIDKIVSLKYPQKLVGEKMTVLPMGGMFKRDVYERLNVIK